MMKAAAIRKRKKKEKLFLEIFAYESKQNLTEQEQGNSKMV